MSRDDFDASAYLIEYYRKVDAENRFLLDFLAAVYKGMGSIPALAELGGGPTIYQLISAAAVCDRISFYEPSQACRDAVMAWINQTDDSFSWDSFVASALEAEGLKPTTAAIQGRRAMLRSKVEHLNPCDLHSATTGVAALPAGGCISVHFATASISVSARDFESVMERVTALVPSKGHLVLSELLNARTYQINGNIPTPCFPVTTDMVADEIKRTGLTILHQEHLWVQPDRGFEGMIALHAVRP